MKPYLEGTMISNNMARVRDRAEGWQADVADSTGRNSEWIPDLHGDSSEVPPCSVGIKRIQNKNRGSTSSAEKRYANRPMDLTTGNAALSMASPAAATRSGTEAAKTKSSLSAFTAAALMAAAVPPVASHRERSVNI